MVVRSRERVYRAIRVTMRVLAALSLTLATITGLWAGTWEAGAATPPYMFYGSAPATPDAALQKIVEEAVGDLPGVWGVAVKKLDTGQYASFNGDRQHVSASLYKLWVLNELFRQAKAGIVDLDGYASVTGGDTYYDSLQGGARYVPGAALTLRQAAYMMVTVSDNTTALMLVRILGPDNVNRFMRQNGLTRSYLDWGVGDNLTTPNDILRDLELIATSQMVDAEASKQMMEILLDQTVNNLLAPGLPRGTPFGHKHGSLGGRLHDAGVVYGPSGPFVIVAMSSGLSSYSTAYNGMPELMRRVYAYFNSEGQNPSLRFAQTGQTVEGDLLRFWHANGGVKQFGYPIGPASKRGDLLVQPFERARLELHPESAKSGGPYPRVLLGLVGQERAAQLNLSWPTSQKPVGAKFFPATGQGIGEDFYGYWVNNGGERIFGYPISPAAEMTNPTNGKKYLTQWFQRARMELHPELPAGQRVLLGLLGTEAMFHLQSTLPYKKR